MRTIRPTKKWKTVLFSLITALSFFGTSVGATYEWRAYNDVFSGANVVSIVIDPETTDTVYALTAQRGVYKSTNGGISWTAANSGLPNTKTVYGGFTGNLLVQDPTAPGTLYGNFGGAVYKTTNSASTWTVANTGIPSCGAYPVSVGVVIDPHIAGHLLDRRLMSGCAHALYESDDSGATWSVIETTGDLANDIVDLAYDSVTADTLYVATIYIGFLRSEDGGITWTTKAPPEGDSQGYAVAAHPSVSGRVLYGDGNGMFLSEDGGDTWSTISNVTGPIRQIVFSASAEDTAYAVGDSTIWKTTDGGFTWVSKWSYAGASFHSIAVDPNTPSTIYVGSTLTGIYKSTDSGASITSKNSGLPVDISLTGLAFASPSTDTMYAAVSGNGFYKSTDRGYTWTLQSSVYTDVNTSYYILVDPNDEDTIYAGFEKIMKSTDGGVTFATVYDPPGDQYFQAAAIDPGNASHVIIAEGSTAYETTDAGDSWSSVANLTPASYIMRLRFDESDPQKVYAATYDYFWRSVDNGANWSQITDGLGLTYANWQDDLAIDPDDHDVLYIATRADKVYRSTDGGLTWGPTSYFSDTGGDTPKRIIATTNKLYAFGTFGIKESTDSGSIWNTISETGLTSSFYTFKWQTIIDPEDENRILTGDFYQGLIIFDDVEPVFSNSTFDVVDENGGVLLIGDIITTSGIIKNSGTTNLSDVELRTTIPTQVQYEDGSAVVDGSIITNAIEGSEIVIPIGSLVRNATASYEFQVRVVKGGSLAITTTVSSTESTSPSSLGIENFTAIPALSFQAASVEDSEGEIIPFLVGLNASSSDPITVDYTTTGGTATAGTDYTSASGTLTIPAGSTTGTISITTTEDNNIESNETFGVTLSNPTGAVLVSPTVSTGTIINDDTTQPSQGGGGGGGGGYTMPTPTPTPTTDPRSLFNSLVTQVAALQKSRINTPAGLGKTFTRMLQEGMRGEDVRNLQIYLNTHGFPVASSGAGSSGRETTYFGKATQNALIRFQNAHPAETLTPLGLTKGNGILGTATRNFIETQSRGEDTGVSSIVTPTSTPDLLAQIGMLQQQVRELTAKTTSPVSPSPLRFTRNLKFGDTGADVRSLQIYLNTHGFPVASSGAGSSGRETTYFGKATQNALIRFQNAHPAETLTPLGLTKGNGILGTATRNFIN